MPALEACCRRWEFGSDDLVFPGFGSLIVRIAWLLGTVVAVGYFSEALGCSQSHLLTGFTFAVIAIIMITIVIEGAIVLVSARGPIVKPKKRWPVKHLLHLRLFVFLCEVVLLVIGTGLSFTSASNDAFVSHANGSNGSSNAVGDCPKLHQAYLLVQVIAVIDWCVLVMLVVFTVLYLDPCHCYSVRFDLSPLAAETARHLEGTAAETARHWHAVESAWERRFQVACCFAGSDDKHQLAYREVAQLFAHFFGDMNVVMSDVAAGLVLLQKQHLANRQRDPEEAGGRPVDLRSRDDVEAFKSAAYFMKYALAVYSWPLYTYMNPLCGCCKLVRRLSCSPRSEPPSHVVVGDNCCSCYFAGIRQIADLDDTDIVYVSLANDLYQSPFFVALDHDCASVVVSIRGTLSMKDVVTDLVAHPKPIELPDSPGFTVHKGMLQTAMWIHDKLLQERILEEAFRSAPEYSLIIAGHSLGSGCACILGMLLRPRYPDLHCYCYSPPGSVVNEAGARYTESFITSVTLGQDLVSCANVNTFHAMKEDLVRVIEGCKKPKYRILLEGGLETTCWCLGKGVVFHDRTVTRGEEEEEGEHGPGEELKPLHSPDPESSLSFTPIISKHLAKTEEHPEKLFLPGRIIHLVDVGEARGYCGRERRLRPYWTPCTAFDKIQVSPDMIRDHFPDVLFAAMDKILEDTNSNIEGSTVNDSMLP